MKRGTIVLSLGLVLAMTAPAFAYEAFKGPLGVLQNREGVSPGYVLLAPEDSTITYLMDNDGNVINQWKSEHLGFSAEMLPNGNMIRSSRPDGYEPSGFGGTCGLLEEFDWAGNIVWSHEMYIPGVEVSHHTFEVMPNGNYMVLGWEHKPYDEVIAAGLDPNGPGRTIFPDPGFRQYNGVYVSGMWPDFIREIDHDHNVVWEWHVWDHLGTGPNQWNINKYIPPHVSRAYAGPDWTHFNGVAYNPRTNQLCVTSRNLAEVYVIDYATGDMVYRWGNPFNYDAGKAPGGYHDDGDQKLFGPHAPDWTMDNTITILDNGTHRPTDSYTRAVELDPATSKVVWEWSANDVVAAPSNFYSAYQCGAQKLANGNWLITSTENGHLVEVQPDKKIVWEFVCPIIEDQVYRTSDPHGYANGGIHKAMRYFPDYPGFAGKDMTPRYALPNWVEILSDNPGPSSPWAGIDWD